MAMPLVSILTAPLVAAYGAMPGRPNSLWTEQMLMILPRRRAIMNWAAAWLTWNTLSRLVRINASQSSSE